MYDGCLPIRVEEPRLRVLSMQKVGHYVIPQLLPWGLVPKTPKQLVSILILAM